MLDVLIKIRDEKNMIKYLIHHKIIQLEHRINNHFILPHTLTFKIIMAC